ncbi:MAG: hypothetical protein ACOCZV_01840 [Nanoarchaeota archaeon]
MARRPIPVSLDTLLAFQRPDRKDLDDLKISENYFSALQFGVIQNISRGLARRLADRFDIPEQQFKSLSVKDGIYDAFLDDDQHLLFSTEQASRFSTPFDRTILRYDDIDKETMVSLLNQHHSTIRVPGAMPRLISNIANYFAKMPEAHGLFEHEDDHVIFTLDDSVYAADDFITLRDCGEGDDPSVTRYEVKRDFVPPLFKEIYADSGMIDRFYGWSSVKDRYNTVRFVLDHDMSSRLKRSIAHDLESDTLFDTVSEGRVDWLLQDSYSGSFSKDGRMNYYTGKRPIFTLPDGSRQLDMHLYFTQSHPDTVSPLVDTFMPSIQQQLLLKRMYYRMTHPVD